MLRLRRDVSGWLTVPGAQRVCEDDEKVHLALDPESRGTCEPLPLAGIVLLHVGDGIALERAEPVEAIRALWRVTQNIPTASGREQCFGDVTELAETVPVWKLVRPLSREALDGAARLVVEVAGAR
jgi:hypothetical protein